MSARALSHTEAAMLVSHRLREVWTTDEKKRLNRCSKDFNSHGDKLLLVCGNLTCPDQRITLQRDQTVPGGMVLRCGCRDRVFSPSC